jgi:hypothetical protein
MCRWYHMFSANGMDQKCARKGLAQQRARHAGDMSASPEQGEACELAEVTRGKASQAFERVHTHESIRRKHRVSALLSIRVLKLLVLAAVTAVSAQRTGAAASLERRRCEPTGRSRRSDSRAAAPVL